MLEADFGGIWVFFPSLCCAQPVLKQWACKHSCVMELPFRQLPISPARMCWKKLVEKGAKAQGGWWWGLKGTQLPFPLSCSVCLSRLPTSTSLLTFSASLSWVGGGSCPRHVTGIWGDFLILNVCFGEVMMITRLSCSSWHCNWKLSSHFMTMAVPLLLVSFKHLLLPRTAPHRRLPWTWIIKAILSMIICTSVIFCSHGFFFFFNKQHNY